MDEQIRQIIASKPAGVTEESFRIFLAYAKDADNWSGEPLVGYGGNVCFSREAACKERGNLTQLKQAGLINTFTDRNCTFIVFTPAGKAIAEANGFEIRS